MAETYCGKMCNECDRKAVLQCPGCRVGPGKPYGTECAIAKCAITRAHHGCEDCANATTCATLKSRSSAAEDRYMKQAREKAELSRRVENSAELGKWLMVLFWLLIGSVIVKFVIELMGRQLSPLASRSITLSVAVAQALILIRLSSTSYCFKMAGIFNLIYLAVDFVTGFMESEGLLIVLTLAGMVLSVLSAYQEFMGYAEVTEDINEKLSQKWGKLWVLYFVCLCATVISAILTILQIEIGLSVLLLSVVGTLVVAIVKLVYLWDTIRTFRQYYEEVKYFV